MCIVWYWLLLAPRAPHAQLGANPLSRNKAGYTVTGLAAERNRTKSLNFFLSLGLTPEKPLL